MNYLSQLPEVSSVSIDGDLIELEMESEIEKPPINIKDDPIVFVAHYAGQVTVVVGKVLDYKKIKGPEIFCKLTFKGSCATFTV